jgi:hypothetical protein
MLQARPNQLLPLLETQGTASGEDDIGLQIVMLTNQQRSREGALLRSDNGGRTLRQRRTQASECGCGGLVARPGPREACRIRRIAA